MTETLPIVTVLLTVVAIAEWLARRGIGRQIGCGVIVIALSAILTNIGILPSVAEAPLVYGVVLSVGAPVSIFLLLIKCHLTALKLAGGPMLAAFALGAFGTLFGVTAAAWLTGMYVATYIGGGANFNALALHYNIVNELLLFAAANAVDNVVTIVWITSLLVIPPLLRRWLPTRTTVRVVDPQPQKVTPPLAKKQQSDLLSMAMPLAMAFAAHLASVWTSTQLEAIIGWSVPSILILTTLALAAAQLRATQRLVGAQVLGIYGSYLFLAVIGAYCDFAALAGLGQFALMLTMFVGLAVTLHGLVVFGTGVLFKADPDILAIASTANIAGSNTVLPLAQNLNCMELLVPGILVGSLGNGIGTYLGFAVVSVMGG